jgi:hypothetical protein
MPCYFATDADSIPRKRNKPGSKCPFAEAVLLFQGPEESAEVAELPLEYSRRELHGPGTKLQAPEKTESRL